MTVALSRLRDCFEGVIPSIVATLDAEGTPNASYLSQVYLVDDQHVALSNQFFSKTAANVRATGRATVLVVSGRTGVQHLLEAVHLSSLTQGEVFETMAAQLHAISAHSGADAHMALRSAELYRVVAHRVVAGPPPPVGAALPDSPDHLQQSARLGVALASCSDAEHMLDAVLDGLTGALGYSHAMVLTVDEATPRLTALASRGYPVGGAGAEVAFGEGLIGIAASTGRPVRLCDMSRGRRLVAAVRDAAHMDAARFIPLPGLAEPQSQLAAPMISRGVVHGVLFAESPRKFVFGAEDEAALSLIAGHLAAGLQLADLDAQDQAPAQALASPPNDGPGFHVRLFAFDDSLFIDDAYVIKGLPARLLYHFLSIHAETGRRDFSNREIRLEPSLKLPEFKDNLETRLILLRRRLEERATPVRLSRPGRGLIRLEISGRARLEKIRDVGPREQP